ncbi:phosphinothricin N-acetyltransferase [Kordiimonas sediminis]|uniref:Phosphinothricin N-acetyltransferase n=1 Tax=Kordiimonas sediminis TaxID=1735581 RepID=A0A919AXD5_9PROT|nr:GNAT family N-acetyltransferase [Kordiimonas sediminis]GHF30271.1 phosphinothricin N-acetyltransferase [Kordiimonas sediminis]
MAFTIRPYSSLDWEFVKRINQEGIETGHATFDAQPKERSVWENDSYDWSQFVAVSDTGEVCGWVCMWPTSDRCCYSGIAEISIYISKSARGQGVGKALINEAVKASEENGFWTIVAGVFPENTASVKLHHACGFRTVGVREKMGLMAYGPLKNVWRDNLLLERRSKTVGVGT